MLTFVTSITFPRLTAVELTILALSHFFFLLDILDPYLPSIISFPFLLPSPIFYSGIKN